MANATFSSEETIPFNVGDWEKLPLQTLRELHRVRQSAINPTALSNKAAKSASSSRQSPSQSRRIAQLTSETSQGIASVNPITVDANSRQQHTKRAPASSVAVTAKKRKIKPPIEISCKRRQSANSLYSTKKKNSSLRSEVRDPRFSELSGTLNQELCGEAYKFVNDLRRKEKRLLQQIVQSGKRPESLSLEAFNVTNIENFALARKIKITADEKQLALSMLARMESQDTLRRNQTKLAAVKHTLQQEERRKIVETGKKPYFMRPSKIKKLLKESQSEKKKAFALQRKERKLSIKEKRQNKIPKRRYSADNQ